MLLSQYISRWRGHSTPHYWATDRADSRAIQPLIHGREAGEVISMKHNTLILTVVAVLSASCTFYTPAGASVEGFNSELGTYVKDGVVDYQSWSGDRAGLDAFITSLADVDLESLSETQSKTLLINAYNAFMVWMILEHYPINGVLDIKPKVFKQKKLNLGGEMVSLDNIEHDHLRKMGDPRIHFAIVCGSKGCPDLASEAYTVEKLDTQLDKAAQRYLSLPKGLVVDEETSVVKLSKILDWFGGDFGETERERLQALAQFAPEKHRDLLRGKHGRVKVKYIEYDWSLNGK